MTNDDEVREDPAPDGWAWPPPHPSPPLPPPREYGSPGTPPPPRAWLWAVAAAVVLGLLISGGLAYIVSGIGDESSADESAAPRTPVPSATPSSGAAGSSSSPSGSPSASPTDSAAGASAPYRCWDGTGAQALDDCSLPTGEAGLRWLFPNLENQRCSVSATKEPGAVARVLCRGKLSDQSRVVFGYYQWESVEAGTAFYEGQGLRRADAEGFLGWTSANGDTLKAALLYADAPFSQTVTLPADAQPDADDAAVLSPRPPAEVRGVPAD